MNSLRVIPDESLNEVVGGHRCRRYRRRCDSYVVRRRVCTVTRYRCRRVCTRPCARRCTRRFCGW